MPLSAPFSTAPVLPTRGVAALAGAVLSAAAACGPALADPLPMPSVDFALTASLKRGGTLKLAHSQSRMRVEMTNPNLPTPILGLIDLNARRMVMMLPNVPNMAMEIDIPKEYSVGALAGSGTKVGQSQAAGESCDVWEVDPQANLTSATTFACITADGIALRTEVEIEGKKSTVYEVTELTRAPQDPSQFALPPGAQVVKVPKGKLGSALGIPGLGGLGGGITLPR
jgi:hypothetical protein